MKLLTSSFGLTFWVFFASFSLSFTSLFLFFISRPPVAPNVLGTEKVQGCTRIGEATLTAPDAKPVSKGFDEWGYNYEEQIFSGSLCEAYRNASWCQSFKDVELVVRWNEAFLSNKDCNGDHVLDRHPGYLNYQGSGAWLTNNVWGFYIGSDGSEHSWTYFLKIIAAPETANLEGGVWYDEDGKEIGQEIWGQFAIFEEIYSDPYGGYRDYVHMMPVGPGFATY